jgi:hypothetical protein
MHYVNCSIAHVGYQTEGRFNVGVDINSREEALPQC